LVFEHLSRNGLLWSDIELNRLPTLSISLGSGI